MTLRKLHTLLSVGIALALSLPLAAQSSSGTGTITGRVLNPSTQEYIRNVEVRADGTNLSVTTEDAGHYELRNVPAGTVNLVVTYPGAPVANATVTLPAGGTVTKDFELTLTGGGVVPKKDDVIQLSAFVVTTAREGQSKMIAEQKQAMNIKQVVSSDNFGDMSEQNIGEFLKYMPGITIDYVETDTRSASMSGMDPKYGYVTLDGNAQASGSSGAFGESDRQFEFESVSMNNIESIEVNKTLTADMWGDAPAGTVNLRTRSALDRKGSRGSVTTGLIWNSLENGLIKDALKKTPRHDDDLHAKTRPRFSFDYNSGAIFGGKLGFTANASYSSIYKEQFREALTYDYTSAQAAAARSPLVTAVNYKDGPKIVDKSTAGIRVDYQAFPGLRMSVAASYAYFSDFFANRNLNFVTSSANLGAGSTINRVVANNSNNTNTRVDQSGESTGKLKDNTNLSYLANYKSGPWTADLSALYSRARERRGGLYYNQIGNAPTRLSRVGFTAERSAADSAAWNISQTSGGDWFNLSNWGVFDGQDVNSNGQYGKTEQYTAKLDLKRVMAWPIPTILRTGYGRNVMFKHRWINESFVGRYVGTTGNALTAGMPQSKAFFLIDKGWGGGIAPLPVVDKKVLYYDMRNHPEMFTQSEANLATQLTNTLGSYNGNQEDVNAGYVMGETKLGRWQLVAGVRYEGTNTVTKAPNEVPVEENPFAVVASRIINPGTPQQQTITTFVPGATQNYARYRFSRGMSTQYAEYGDWMPSIAAKYPITQGLFLKLGYNKAIKRPNLNNVAGAWTVDNNTTTGNVTITVPNPSLKPERSERFSVMIEAYFKSQGTASIHVFQSNIKNAIDNNADGIPGSELGFNDSEFDNVFFETFQNISETRRFRGIELSYSQPFTFLHNRILRAFSVFGTYSQFNVTPRPRNGTRFFPNSASGGVTWSYDRLLLQVNGTWTNETFVGETTAESSTSLFHPGAPEYFKPRTILFVNARYRLTRNFSVFASGDRAYDSGKIWYYKSDNRIRQIEKYGSQWSVGAKADF